VNEFSRARALNGSDEPQTYRLDFLAGFRFDRNVPVDEISTANLPTDRPFWFCL
jgi:hypothetical protein